MSNMNDHRQDIQILPLAEGEKNTILPLTRKEIPTDKVYILPTGEIQDSVLGQTPENILSEMMGFDVEQRPPTETIDEQYVAIYELIQQHAAEEATIWINGSEVPHASMLAATVGASEYATSRGALHYYRVTDEEYEEIPLPVDPIEITPIRAEILTYLANGSEARSISEMASGLADGELDSSFRGNVQYNTETLAEAGFLNRVNRGNRMEPQLTRMGELWIETHIAK